MKKRLNRSRWNWYAFLFNIIWYFKHGIMDKAVIMLVLTLFSLGAGIIPVAVYCGAKGNEDRFRSSIGKIIL